MRARRSRHVKVNGVAKSEIRDQRCSICNCRLTRVSGTYADGTVLGRSHASRHHCVAERFFGRSANRKGVREALFDECPWGQEGKRLMFCYECHEELLHNPVLLPQDIALFARLVRERGLSEDDKSDRRHFLRGRVVLLHEVIAAGLSSVAGSQR